jgi:hypothetical protein
MLSKISILTVRGQSTESIKVATMQNVVYVVKALRLAVSVGCFILLMIGIFTALTVVDLGKRCLGCRK